MRRSRREVRAKGRDRRPPLQGQKGALTHVLPAPSPQVTQQRAGGGPGVRSVPGTVPWPYLVGPLDPLHIREVDLEKRRPEGKLDLRPARSWNQKGFLGQQGHAGGRSPPSHRRLASDSAGPALKEQPGQWGRLQEPGSAHADTDGHQTPAPPDPAWGALLGGSGERSLLPSPLAHRLEPAHSLCKQGPPSWWKPGAPT